jgi:cell division protein FtsW
MKLNTTLMIFLCTMTLLTLGVVMITSSSAAIAARDINKAQVETKGGGVEAERPTLTSHSYYYTKRQIVWAGLAFICMIGVYRVDYDFYKRWGGTIFLACVLLLILVLIPGIGKKVNGARRWLGAGGGYLQASEFAKLGVIIFLSKILSEKNRSLKSWRHGFFPPLCLVGTVCFLIVVEPDLGTAVVVMLIAITMFAVAGMRPAHLLTLVVAAIPLLAGLIIFEPYRMKRLLSFLNPELDRQGSGWQLSQSLISVGSGGWEGLGLGNGPQKYLFLSESYTDFIFASICEELGIWGAGLVIALFVFLMVQGYRVAMKLQDMFGSLLATGITAMIGIQAFINMFVVLGMVPTKGLTLPFVSYGGSSLIVNMVAIGILMSLSREAELISLPTKSTATLRTVRSWGIR